MSRIYSTYTGDIVYDDFSKEVFLNTGGSNWLLYRRSGLPGRSEQIAAYEYVRSVLGPNPIGPAIVTGFSYRNGIYCSSVP